MSVVNKSTLVLQVLNVGVRGHTHESLSIARQSLSGMIQDSDFEYLRDMSGMPKKSSTESSPGSDHRDDTKHTVEQDPVQLAARTVRNVNRKITIAVLQKLQNLTLNRQQ